MAGNCNSWELNNWELLSFRIEFLKEGDQRSYTTPLAHSRKTGLVILKARQNSSGTTVLYQKYMESSRRPRGRSSKLRIILPDDKMTRLAVSLECAELFVGEELPLHELLIEAGHIGCIWPDSHLQALVIGMKAPFEYYASKSMREWEQLYPHWTERLTKNLAELCDDLYDDGKPYFL